MYKVASDNRQSALHRGRPSDWVGGEEKLSRIDQLKQLQSGIKILDARIQALPMGPERRKLGPEKLAMQNQIGELKKLIGLDNRKKEGLSAFIVDAARAILSKSQFDIIYRSAHRDYEHWLKEQDQSVIGDK